MEEIGFGVHGSNSRTQRAKDGRLLSEASLGYIENFEASYKLYSKTLSQKTEKANNTEGC